MATSGVERTIIENRKPLAQIVARLSSQASGIREVWITRLEQCVPCGQYSSTLSDLRVLLRVADLPAGNPRVYGKEVQQHGEDLARRGVPAECVTVAIALYLESCLPHLLAAQQNEAQGNEAPWILTLARWASAYQFFLVSGYSRHEAAERALLEEKMSMAERRVQDFSIVLADAYEAERRRLARDLHDEIGHDLIVLKLYTQVIALDLKKGEISQVHLKLKESVSLIKHALESVRHLTFDLGPAIWKEQGFIPAIRFYVRQFANRTGLKVSLRAGRLTGNLPARYETALYKVMQGSLSNIAAHADAQRVSITIQTRRQSVTMRIEDDGRGFDVEKKLSTPPKCYGLRAMKDRIELLGGSVTFVSQAARRRTARTGTTIEFRLPLLETGTL